MQKFSRGFTLLELLVVIAIVGLLASIVTSQFSEASKKSRDARRLHDMHQLEVALRTYYQIYGHYPGNKYEGVSNSGEFIGDDNGPIERALLKVISTIPKDPLHDGTVYFYSYDPRHCTDSFFGACDCKGECGAVLAFNKAETKGFTLRKDTCSGGDMNQDNADFNIVFYPCPE